MKKRVLSAIVMIALLFMLLILSKWTRILLVIGCGALACREMATALKKSGRAVIPWLGYAFIALCALFMTFSLPVKYLTAASFFLVFVALCLPLFDVTLKPSDALLSFGICLYPVMPVMTIGYILCRDASVWTLSMATGVGAAALCDMFAMFGGKLFGRRKLAPRISPNKTVEGTLVGLLSSVLTGSALYIIFRGTQAGASIPLWFYIFNCAVASSAGQFGDLIASSFKREAGIKDYSNLIPGHGGMLDRIDSHIFAIPCAYILFVLFQYAM